MDKRKNKTNLWMILTALALVQIGVGCKPQMTGQKIEDKAEDVGHEVEQGIERAKENVKEAK